MEDTIPDHKAFPEGMTPLGNATFQFSCHPGLSCFTSCCRNVDMPLYPYDIITLKNKLNLRSAEFLEHHTRVVQGSNSYFPSLMMKMNEDNSCPFLSPEGCEVYKERPFSCRMYPLERAVNRNPGKGEGREFYFLCQHDYCKGHGQGPEWTAKEWIRDQELLFHNAMAEQWTEMDTLFAGNPWEGEGVAGPKQKLAFMVCYNIDDFRGYVSHYNLLSQFKLCRSRVRSIETDDEALLTFGFDWLKLVLIKQPTLRSKGKQEVAG